MSGSLIPANMGAVSNVFAPVIGSKHADELAGGVQSGFAVVSIRGKDWRVKHRGEETVVVNEDGEAARSLKVVIVKGNPHISKIYYEKAFSAGDDAAPDCYSINGVRPEPDSPKMQNPTCADCRWNKFGSRVTENGKKAKACGDSRRLAVVPLGDMENAVYGGPMMLRVPATSLAEMATFTKKMEALGFPYFTIGVRLGFADEAYPKLTFSAIRALTDDEARKVLEYRQSDEVDYMLAQQREDTAPAQTQAEKVASAFEEGAQTPPKALEQAKPEPVVNTALDAAVTAAETPAASEPVKAPAAAKPGPRAAKPAEPKVEVAPAGADALPTSTKEKASAADESLDDILDNLMPD
jgi:hypothetical protein